MLIVPTIIVLSFFSFLEIVVRGKPLQRDENNWIINFCEQCGSRRLSRQKKLKPLCKSCGIKNSFQSRPAVGLKTIDNVDQFMKEYESGRSLSSLGKQYDMSAMTIRAKILTFGEKTRSVPEANRIAHEQYNTIAKAREKIKDMCSTGEFQKNMSARLQGIPIEKWKGFTTPENKRLVASPEYKIWQQTVFKRDKFTCQLCSDHGCPLAAHHIYPKAKYPNRVLDVNNGVTLCNLCHHKTIGHEDEYVDRFRVTHV